MSSIQLNYCPIFAPSNAIGLQIDSSAAGTVLKTAEAVTTPDAVDVAPTSGPVAMVIDGRGLGVMN